MGGKNICSVDGCENRLQGGLSFFRCPKEPRRCQLWKNALGFTVFHKYFDFSPEQCHNCIRICALHFDEDSFSNSSKSRIHNYAVPSLRLPIDSIREDDIHIGTSAYNMAVSNTNENDDDQFYVETNIRTNDACVQTTYLDYAHYSDHKHACTQTTLMFSDNSLTKSALKESVKTLERTMSTDRCKRKLETEVTLDDVVKFLENRYSEESCRFLKNQLYLLNKAPKELRLDQWNPISENRTIIEEDNDYVCVKEEIKKEEIHIKSEDKEARFDQQSFNVDLVFPASSEEGVKYDKHSGFECVEVDIKSEEIHIKSEDVEEASENGIKYDEENNDVECVERYINNEDIYIISDDEEETSKLTSCILKEHHYSENSIFVIQPYEDHPQTLKRKNSKKLTMFKCGYCSFEAKEIPQLKIHLTVVHQDIEELIKCKHCSYQSTRENVNSHALIHKNHELAVIKCEYCSYEAKGRPQLKIHLSTVHRNNKELVKCKHCSYQSTRINVDCHSIIHQNHERPMFNCGHCSFQTKLKDSMELHILAHKKPENVSIFQCSECFYKTKHKRDLNKHMLIHKSVEDTTIFKCDQCPYRTKQKLDVHRHTLTNKKSAGNNEPFVLKCKYCSFQTVWKDSLNWHLLIHEKRENVTIYHCGQCFFRSKYKSDLNEHALLHRHLKM